MPYVEQENVFQLYQNWGGNDSTGPRYSSSPNTTNVCNKRFDIFTCPSDEPNRPFGNLTNHNYAVNFGNTTYGQQANLNGVIFRRAPFGRGKDQIEKQRGNPLSSIADGTSSTLLVAEVLQGQERDLRGFTWWGDASQFTTYLAPNSSQPDRIYTSYYCNNQPDRNLPCAASSGSSPTMFASRSRHPGGVQVAFADGSARLIPQNIDLNVWRALSTSQGGEVVDD